MDKKPKVSIIIPTLGRDSLYPLIENLLKQKVKFAYEIVLIPQVKLQEDKLKDKRIKIFFEELGKGFAYYRNIGIKKSKSDVLVFIDDDELPMNNKWLYNITKPILSGEELIATSGYKIKLNQGYLTDCISLLGFPGGGAVGFEIMWPLKEKDYTCHICSGNFSIIKKIMTLVGNFSENFRYGNEDVDLGDKLVSNGFKIKYLEEATVYHIARKGLINFIKWNFLRGKSAGEYLSNKKGTGKVSGRLSSSKRILIKVLKERIIYLPGVLFMMFNQYLWQTAGYVIIRGGIR